MSSVLNGPVSALQVGYVRGSGTTTLLLHTLYPLAFPEYYNLSVSLSPSLGVWPYRESI